MKMDFGSYQVFMSQSQILDNYVSFAAAAYAKLKKSGLLQEVGRDFLSVVTCARACMVSNDIESWKAYKEAGMPDGLIAALMLRSRDVFGDMAKEAMENAGKKIQKGGSGARQ